LVLRALPKIRKNKIRIEPLLEEVVWALGYKPFANSRRTSLDKKLFDLSKEERDHLVSFFKNRSQLKKELRELGEAIILINQHPSLISKPALGNTYTTIALNLKHRDDVDAISDCMLLDHDKKEYLNKLGTGKGIVKLQGRWDRPFLVGFPLVDVEKEVVGDKDVKRR